MLQNGAKRVAFVDQSATAIADCRENLRLNALSGASFHEGNAFDILRAWEESNEKADIIVLDPPSFTKSRSSKGNALRGYKEINLRALKALRRGGYLVSASCSQAVSRQEFEMMMYSAATDVGARLRLVYRGGQPADHPVVLNIFETDYLKFYIFEKLS
jgi:23S rRNA (cytosine1962-C5)-methyltransferase